MALREGKVISSSCGLSRNALLFHELFLFLQGWGEIPLPLVEISGPTTKKKRAYVRWRNTKVVFFTKPAICLDISIKRTELPGPTVTFISSYSKASVECRLCVPLTFSFLPFPFVPVVANLSRSLLLTLHAIIPRNGDATKAIVPYPISYNRNPLTQPFSIVPRESRVKRSVKIISNSSPVRNSVACTWSINDYP